MLLFVPFYDKFYIPWVITLYVWIDWMLNKMKWNEKTNLRGWNWLRITSIGGGFKSLLPVSEGFGRFWNVKLCSLVHGDQCFRGIYCPFLQCPLLYVTARWNHIEDLDSFFTRMYHYHQKHGFTCMMLKETLELLQFIFVVVFSTFLFNCVDYSVLFRYSYIL